MKIRYRSVFFYRFICLLILILGFVLRVRNLGEHSLWFDEAMEYWVATSPFSEILSNARIALQDPPLYSILLSFWLRVCHTEFEIRFLSLIFSMGGILGVIVLTDTIFGKKESTLAGLLVAVSILDIWYAQEAGQYALMGFFLIWNLVFLNLLMIENLWRWAVLWVMTGVAAIYSHYGATVTISTTFLVCFVYTISKQYFSKLFKIVISVGVIIIFVSPLILYWLPVQMFRGPTTAAFQFSLGTFRDELIRFLNQVINIIKMVFMGFSLYDWPWPWLPEWVLLIPIVYFLSVCFLRYAHRFAIIWFLVGFLVNYALSRVGAYPLGGRYFLILAPLFWISLAVGIVESLSPKNRVALKCISVFMLFSLVFLVVYVTPIRQQEDLRSVTQQWLLLRKPSEATYVYYGAVPGFRYQLKLLDISEPVPPLWYIHCWEGKEAEYCTENNINYGTWIRFLKPKEKRQAILESLEKRTDRLWLIFSHIHKDEDNLILLALKDNYFIEDIYIFENSSLYLLEQK